MKFAIITYILHKEHNKSYYSYEPYIREMNIWLSNADEVIVLAPKILSIPNTIETPYVHPKIAFLKIPGISFLNFREIIRSLIKFPRVCYVIFKAMKEADHIHLRCPGNIGLIACFIQILFPNKPKTVKYAGNWDPNSKQPWSYRFQKWILRNIFLSRNIKVLVYGDWPEQSKNILPFFTASFSETEKGLPNKDFIFPFKFIFVGSLSPGKRPLFAIKLIEFLMGKGIPVKLEIYGSGVLKNELQEYIATKNLDPFVRLMGNCKLEELKGVYKASHFLILASQSEGWPKAIAEAMFFGCIPIATSVSCVPYMLDHGEQGILIEPELDKAGLSVLSYLKDEKKLDDVSKRALTWSRQFTLEKFEKEITNLI
ncbi:glycosyltransferase involved in cell wall biosynthesis [Gillisia mitskevichiae]|uniref:Glycosyltransferase involved in cell wall biosynthesis n=1 Tax=Gillisia mitskevichiae TaxID=270921 RepID=A0A495P6W5_9FLAO|nr:glycosyltransferase family 4 protein [Gillisia mitskevichiae]RKS45158.1 glycosyltransferase involved in cell wall biosynthesis [Gillisia mitskevichiae]